jgi:hypothetical protein
LNLVREAFLDAYAGTRALLAAPQLAARWDDPSALELFSVKGLAGHLVRAGQAVLAYLAEPLPADAVAVDAPDYYAIVLASMDDAAHAAVRERGEANAADGLGALAAGRDKAEATLRDVLPAEPEDRLAKVFGDLVLLLDDYLVTRIVEILVHADDLAVSIGIDPPPMPRAAADLAIAHLVDVARVRHGNRAVLVALSRRERDAAQALRVF